MYVHCLKKNLLDLYTDPLKQCAAVEDLGVHTIRNVGRSAFTVLLDSRFDRLLACTIAKLLILVGGDVRYRTKRTNANQWDTILLIGRVSNENALHELLDRALALLNKCLQKYSFDEIVSAITLHAALPNCHTADEAFGYLKVTLDYVKACGNVSGDDRTPDSESNSHVGIRMHDIKVNLRNKIVYVGPYEVNLKGKCAIPDVLPTKVKGAKRNQHEKVCNLGPYCCRNRGSGVQKHVKRRCEN